MPKLTAPNLFFCQHQGFIANKSDILEVATLFNKAVAERDLLNIPLCSKTFVKLYSLYKQATEGDIKIPAPSNQFDHLETAKYKAWLALKGKSTKDAQTEYIKLVNTLKN